MPAMDNFLAQVAFRGRNDDGNETGATWIADTNQNWEQRPDRNFRIRLKIDATDVEGRFSTLFYGINGSGGAFTQVTSSSSVVKATFSTFYTHGEDTTEQLPGAFPYITPNAGMVEGQSTNATSISYTANSEVEVEWCVQIVGDDVVDRQTIHLRSQIGVSVFYDRGYLELPEITVDVPRTIRRTIFM